MRDNQFLKWSQSIMRDNQWWQSFKREHEDISERGLLLRILEEVEEIENDIALIKNNLGLNKAVSAVLYFKNKKGELRVNITVHINDVPLAAALVEFTGPNGSGTIVQGIGPTSFTSSNPAVATVDPVTGNLNYLSVGVTTITGLNSGNGMTASGTLTVITGAAQSAVLEFVAQTTTPSPGIPSITTQPAAATASISTTAPGNMATFSVVAGGTGPFTYQWAVNGVPIGGATSASFTTGPVTASMNGTAYTCAVTNAAGTITSQAALLTVTP
jgi:hypothetical protein